jgi:hypothetical protein
VVLPGHHYHPPVLGLLKMADVGVALLSLTCGVPFVRLGPPSLRAWTSTILSTREFCTQ